MSEALDLGYPFKVIAHEVLTSTNDEAKLLAAKGAAHGTVVWAHRQTGGRGRLDRSWSSPPGNLYMSVIWRVSKPAASVAGIGFAAAVAVAGYVAALLPGIAVSLKWPNDVLAGGGKIAGILIESQSTPSGEIDWVVLGIGLNVALTPADVPYRATSLAEFGAPPKLSAVLLDLLDELQSKLTQWQRDGFEPIRQQWLARGHGIGQPIELRQGERVVAGRFRELDANGALILETESGRQRITTGDVHFT